MGLYSHGRCGVSGLASLFLLALLLMFMFMMGILNLLKWLACGAALAVTTQVRDPVLRQGRNPDHLGMNDYSDYQTTRPFTTAQDSGPKIGSLNESMDVKEK